jgi:hypothetical protein
VTNIFQALELWGRENESDDPAFLRRVESAARFIARDRLKRARQVLATEPRPGAHSDARDRENAREVLAWAAESPGDFWIDGREPEPEDAA